MPQPDPYSTSHISPQVSKPKLNAKRTITTLERRTSSKVDHATKTTRSTRLFSDDSDEEINTAKPEAIPLLNPQVNNLITQKRTTNRRKASFPPFIHQGEYLPRSYARQEGAGDGAELGWEEMVGTLLIWTVRVLEMLARREQGNMQNIERWGEIRRIAERMI